MCAQNVQTNQTITLQELDHQLNIAWELRDISPEKALEEAQIINLKATQTGYALGIAASLVIQGDALWRLSRYPDAIDCLIQAERQLQALPNCQWHIAFHHSYGVIYSKLGDLEQALEQFILAWQIAQELNNRVWVASSESSVAVVYAELGEFQKSTEMFYRALEEAKGTNDRRMQHVVYINLANVYMLLENFDNVIAMSEYALELADTDRERLAARRNLGSGYMRLGDYDQAANYLENALVLARTLDLDETLCATILSIADYLIEIGEYDRAVELLEEGLQIALHTDAKHYQERYYSSFYLAYLKMGNHKQALNFHKKLFEVNKAIYNDKSDFRIRQLEVLYQVKQLLEANERQQREFDALTKMKNSLLNDFSHDLKNPLASIMGSAELMIELIKRDKVELEQFMRILDRIQSQSKRMKSLIVDVLDIARLDTGSAINLGKANICDVILEVLTNLKNLAAAKGVEIEFECNAPVYLVVDSLAISRCLENIINNAIKYTPQGGHILVIVQDKGQSGAIITVCDTGMGIPEEKLPYIFERFYRIPNHQTIADGTGLGLAIAKTIVEQHQGTIRVKSEIDHGTVFTITLPHL